jgi:uncharacterized protein (DUF58 family)
MSPPSEPTGQRWLRTWTFRRAVTLLAVGGALSLVAGRPDVALVGLPLAVGVAMAWAGRTPDPGPRIRVTTPKLAEQRGPARAAVEISGAGEAELTVVRMPHGVGAGTAIVLGPSAGGAAQRVTVPVDTSDWGLREFGGAAARLATADGLYASPVVTAHAGPTRVLPAIQPVPAAELPARAAGQVGAHRTRRPGDGSELLDVREFRPGDRMRRIDWRVSARRGVLHVRHTAIDADADLVICLDSRFDLGDDVATWSNRRPWAPGRPRGCLATSITGAAALAATYLRLGDRVGLVDLSVPYRVVPPGTGVRQLMRIRWQLAGIVPDSQLRRRAFGEGSVPSGAVTVVFSPFVDEQIDRVVGSLARAGHDLVAIDVLPDPARMPDDRAENLAARIVLAERRERLAGLRRRGVLVTPWDPALIGLLMRRRQRARRS